MILKRQSKILYRTLTNLSLTQTLVIQLQGSQERDLLSDQKERLNRLDLGRKQNQAQE